MCRRPTLISRSPVALLVVAFLAMSPARAAAAPVPARPADSFVESVGVNVHLGYSDTVYGQEALIRDKLVALGVRYVRDGLSQGRPDVYRRLRELGAAGVRTNLIIGDPLQRWGVGPLDQQLTTVKSLGTAVASLEGPNEYDIQGDANWVARVRDYQRDFFTKVKADAQLQQLPVLGPTVVHRASRDSLGDVSQWLDYGNMHPYPGGNAPDRDAHLADEFAMASKNSASKPVQATETGYHNGVATTDGHLPASERAAGIYLPRLYLDYFRRGIARAYAYELIDQRPDSSHTDSEAAFGLLRNDFSEKPAYTSLKRLLALLGDRGPSFATTPLDYTVQGAPAGLRQLLLQKRDGSWYLVIWNATSVWDPSRRLELTPAGAQVTLGLPAPMAVETYDPQLSSAPVSVAERATSLSLTVSEHATVVKLVPGESPPPASGTPALGPQTGTPAPGPGPGTPAPGPGTTAPGTVSPAAPKPVRRRRKPRATTLRIGTAVKAHRATGKRTSRPARKRPGRR